MKKVLILGATSFIAQALARLLAARGASLFLAGRNPEHLEAVRADLQARGAAQVQAMALDLTQADRHAELIAAAKDALGGLDSAVLAYGILGSQTDGEKSFGAANQVLQTNFNSAVSIFGQLANLFAEQGGGILVALSSVAGDRGRQSNYLYGASKAGLNVFLQGLRNRLYLSRVSVLTVKPGFVDTPMTQKMAKNPLFTTPEKVARGILRAADARRDVVYVPCFWRYILWVIRLIPERWFKRLKL